MNVPKFQFRGVFVPAEIILLLMEKKITADDVTNFVMCEVETGHFWTAAQRTTAQKLTALGVKIGGA